MLQASRDESSKLERSRWYMPLKRKHEYKVHSRRWVPWSVDTEGKMYYENRLKKKSLNIGVRWTRYLEDKPKCVSLYWLIE